MKKTVFKTSRKPLNPVDPKYDWAEPEPPRPASAKKFLRDNLNVSDIEGALPVHHIPERLKRETNYVEDIEGTKAKPQKVLFLLEIKQH